MAKMVRKQVYLEDAQERRLKARAREFDVPESVMIREGLAVVLRRQPLVRDARAWKAEMGFIARRAARAVPSGKRTWLREDLYDDRVSRRH
jgi:hypothetical protein